MIVELPQSHPDYPDLTPGKPYGVIGIEGDDLRLINDQGQPYLYPKDLFEIVDDRHPEDWVEEVGEDGELYAYPPDLNAPSFFEDFHDHEPRAVATFWHVVNARLATAAG